MIILTDLSEVLINGVCGTEKIIKERYGKQVSKEFLQRRTDVNPIFRELLRGHIPEDVYWYVFLQRKKWPFSASELKEVFSCNLVKEIPGTLDMYRRIIGYPDKAKRATALVKGRPTFWLASDHIFERKMELEYLHPDIFRLTSKQIWSFEHSMIKSDPGFFERILSCYDLLPEEVVFIDDLQINVDQAEAAGITSIRFEDAKQLEMELSYLGFLFADTVREANEINAR